MLLKRISAGNIGLYRYIFGCFKGSAPPLKCCVSCSSCVALGGCQIFFLHKSKDHSAEIKSAALLSSCNTQRTEPKALDLLHPMVQSVQSQSNSPSPKRMNEATTDSCHQPMEKDPPASPRAPAGSAFFSFLKKKLGQGLNPHALKSPLRQRRSKKGQRKRRRSEQGSRVPFVNIKVGDKWMLIHPKMEP